MPKLKSQIGGLLDSSGDGIDYSKLFKRVKIIGSIALVIFLLWVFLDKVTTVIRFSNMVLHLSYYIIPLLILAWYKFYRKDKTPVIVNQETVDTTDFIDEIFASMKQYISLYTDTKDSIDRNINGNNNRTTNKKTSCDNMNSIKSRRNVTNKMKKMVASEQMWECGLCNCLLDASYEVDHITPLYMNGTNDRNNLMALCRNCHGMKTMYDGVS